MSGITGEIGFKIGAAANQLVRVDQIMTTTAGGTALTVQGPFMVTGVSTISTGLLVENLVSTTRQFVLTAKSVGSVGSSFGFQVQAGNATIDVPIQVLDSAGTGTLHMVSGDGHGVIGYNYTAGKSVIKFSALGQVDIIGALTVTETSSSTEYHSLTPAGATFSCTPANSPLLVYAPGTALSAGGNKAFAVTANNVVVISSATAYTWGTGTNYPTLQFSGIGAIMGTGTIGLNIMAGGLYYNGTNYIYGQAGTGIIASLGTGSYTISCVSTSGTAGGTATPTVVFSIGGTVTSNTIRGYGPTAAALVDMTPDTGTYTGTLNGVNAAVNPIVHWSRQGNQVTLMFPTGGSSGVGTSTSATLTITGLPAALQTARVQFMACVVQDSGSDCAGGAEIAASSGTITFYRGVVSGTQLQFSASGFTSSGQKGVDETSVTYSLA